MTFVAMICRTAVAAVLLTAVVGKVGGRARWAAFRATAGHSAPIGPPGAVAAAVVAAEVTVAGLVLVDRTTTWGLTAAGVLFAGFTGVLVRLRRSRAACACFGAGSGPVGPAELARNGVLLALCVLGLLTADPGPVDAAAVVAGALTAALVVFAPQFRALLVPAPTDLRR